MRLYHVVADDIPSHSITGKCIVLDLDQTLVASQDKMESLKELKILADPELLALRNKTYVISIEDLEKPGVGTKLDIWGVTRPHLQEFLIFCFSYFKIVAVWTAGKKPYGEAIVDYIFRGLPQPYILFTSDETIFRPQAVKPLVNMIKEDPSLLHNMSLSNTFALDDNISTFSENQDNGILIPAYNPPPTVPALSRDDPTLLQLKYWLLQPEVVNSKEIRNLDKSKIFSTSIETYRNNLPKQGYQLM